MKIIREFKKKDEQEVLALLNSLEKNHSFCASKMLGDFNCFSYIIEENGKVIAFGSISILVDAIRGIIGYAGKIASDKNSGKNKKVMIEKFLEVAERFRVEEIIFEVQGSANDGRNFFSIMSLEKLKKIYHKK